VILLLLQLLRQLLEARLGGRTLLRFSICQLLQHSMGMAQHGRAQHGTA